MVPLVVTVTPAMKKNLQGEAQATGMTTSEYVRQLLNPSNGAR